MMKSSQFLAEEHWMETRAMHQLTLLVHFWRKILAFFDFISYLTAFYIIFIWKIENINQYKAWTHMQVFL